MQLTVEFTDVYDGEENIRVQNIEVADPPAGDDLDDWAYDHIYPHTGDGKHPSGDAGYFANVRACAERPDLVGREFEWGI